jgi:hypothetical protein
MKDIQVKEQIELLTDATTVVKDKPQSFNIIYVNTPTGQMRIKTQLTATEWIAQQEMRLKNQPKKTKKRK